jgi:asparagine synthase (glutamine-hydrolysing)
MPGLVGIIGKASSERNRSDLLKMHASIQHESFYSLGSYINEQAGIYLGWAVPKGSYSDCMPVWNEKKDTVLFFYGEHYANQEDLKETRIAADDPCGFDARLVLRMFEEKGDSFLKALNGAFHGIVVELKQNKILLFNDKTGMQRLYYQQNEGEFLFASEAKAILKIRRDSRSLESRSVGEFITCGCALENRTLFRNIFVLPSGALWIFSAGNLEQKKQYFQPSEWEDQPLLRKEEAYDGLKDVFRKVIARHCKSKLPLAISLSGGLDTRLIMAYLKECSSEVQSYTFNGMHRESYDLKIARRVATACDIPHHVLSLGRDYLREFPSLSERTVHLSDGGLGVEGGYELYFNKMARRVADVRITGNYGSEVFRRVRQLKAFEPDRRMISPDFYPSIDQAMATYNEISSCHDLSFSVFRQAPWYGYGRMSVEQSQVVIRNPFLDNEFLKYMYRVPEILRSSSDLELYLIHQGNPNLLDIPTDRAERGRYGKMSSPWAHAWAWFIFKADYCYKSGMPQWLEQIHYWLGPIKPEKLIIGRHRFHYYRTWFRKELASHVKEVLLDPKSLKRPYLNEVFLKKMVFGHIKGNRNYADQIEKMLTLEVIHRLFVEMPS